MSIASTLQDTKARLDALLSYANETTGQSDVSIGDAIKTLADGFGGGGGEMEFTKAIDFTAGDDMAYHSFTTDTSGKPLSFEEAIIAVSTCRASSMTSNSSYCIGVIPWRTSYNSRALTYQLSLLSDCYTAIVHIKKRAIFATAQTLWQARTGANAFAIKGIDDLFKSNVYAPVQSNVQVLSYGAFSAKGTDALFDANGKMTCITVGCDMASQLMAAGTRIEAWVR